MLNLCRAVTFLVDTCRSARNVLCPVPRRTSGGRCLRPKEICRVQICRRGVFLCLGGGGSFSLTFSSNSHTCAGAAFQNRQNPSFPSLLRLPLTALAIFSALSNLSAALCNVLPFPNCQNTSVSSLGMKYVSNFDSACKSPLAF